MSKMTIQMPSTSQLLERKGAHIIISGEGFNGKDLNLSVAPGTEDFKAVSQIVKDKEADLSSSLVIQYATGACVLIGHREIWGATL